MNANEMADLMILFDSGRIYEHAEEIATMLRQQQAEIEALKQSKSEGNNKVKTVAEVMAEHCTCYKLGYSQLNNYASVKQK